jgi:hypothetical protein
MQHLHGHFNVAACSWWMLVTLTDGVPPLGMAVAVRLPVDALLPNLLEQQCSYWAPSPQALYAPEARHQARSVWPSTAVREYHGSNKVAVQKNDLQTIMQVIMLLMFNPH